MPRAESASRSSSRVVRRDAAADPASRSSRLRAADFQLVFRERGRSVDRRNFVALWRPCDPGTGGVGFAVTRRIGGAVARNRARRRLREAYRRAAEKAGGVNVVFVARTGALTCGFAELTQDIEQALEAVRDRVSHVRSGPVPGR